MLWVMVAFAVSGGSPFPPSTFPPDTFIQNVPPPSPSITNFTIASKPCNFCCVSGFAFAAVGSIMVYNSSGSASLPISNIFFLSPAFAASSTSFCIV
jgi:hypothetical protein